MAWQQPLTLHHHPSQDSRWRSRSGDSCRPGAEPRACPVPCRKCRPLPPRLRPWQACGVSPAENSSVTDCEERRIINVIHRHIIDSNTLDISIKSMNWISFQFPKLSWIHTSFTKVLMFFNMPNGYGILRHYHIPSCSIRLQSCCSYTYHCLINYERQKLRIITNSFTECALVGVLTLVIVIQGRTIYTAFTWLCSRQTGI